MSPKFEGRARNNERQHNNNIGKIIPDWIFKEHIIVCMLISRDEFTGLQGVCRGTCPPGSGRGGDDLQILQCSVQRDKH